MGECPIETAFAFASSPSPSTSVWTVEASAVRLFSPLGRLLLPLLLPLSSNLFFFSFSFAFSFFCIQWTIPYVSSSSSNSNFCAAKAIGPTLECAS